jgi:hypothetical protein
MTSFGSSKSILDEKMSLNISIPLVTSLQRGCSDLLPKFQGPMRPHEIIMATKYLDVIFETFPQPCLTYRSATQIRRALSDREIQPFDERRVQFHRVLRVPQSLSQSPSSNHRSSSTLTTRSFLRVLIT